MQLNNPNTLGSLDLANKEFYYKSKKGPRWALCIPTKPSKTIWRVMNKLTIKRTILILSWIFKYVILTNLGRKTSQSICRNFGFCIWSETIQAKSFATKFECQASSRDKARLRIVKVCCKSKVYREAKIKLEARPNVPKKKVNIEHVDESRPRKKFKLGLQKLDLKQQKEQGSNLKLD